MSTIDVGIFAYNEGEKISTVLKDITSQDLFSSNQNAWNFYILANGCSDNTVECAQQTIDAMAPQIANCFTVLDLPFKGKSRTWNHFVHTVASESAHYLGFIDADIRIKNTNQFSAMVTALESEPSRQVINSRPVKDISSNADSVGLIGKAIASAGNASEDYKTAICGQLYMAKTSALKHIHMPQGLPVEDGFLRAMLLTELLTEPEDLQRIYAHESIFHEYESIVSIGDLIKHQTRIIIGGAINTTVFDYMRKHASDRTTAIALLKTAAEDKKWLKSVVKDSLPKAPYGYVPFHFLVKRFGLIAKNKQRASVKKWAITLLGFGFDLVVYIVASLKMAMGKGVGYW